MKVSAAKKHCFSGDKFRASRPLDYIYDPLFTFSGPKDYYKAAHESFQSSSEFSVQPIFDSMFSDMVRFPRATLVLRPSHQLPLNIDTSYRGRVRAITQDRTITAEVTGTDRFKYFRRPVTEIKDGSPGEVATRFPLLGLEAVASLGLMAPPTTAQKPATRYAATQVRATQTDYRESEAQTIPWTPPYTCRGHSTPEVLYLDQLSWGDGLPPGKHEVEIVERLRRKRAWESQLPPLDCQENINIRYKIIAEMEKSDWQFREKEIEAIHKERMKKSEELLEQHNMMNRSRLTCRMEYLEDDINKRKEKKLQLIRHEKERALRKLCMREKGYNPKKYKMSVLDEHLCHTSELYAPMKRYGTSFKNRHEPLAQKQFIIDDGDICDFEFAPHYRPVFDFNKASQPKRQTELCVRETRWTMENLVKLHGDLRRLRAKSSKGDAFYAQVEQRPKPSHRSAAIQLPCAKRPLFEESLFQAAVMIQKVVHSRSMQSLMEQKRDCCKELMQELKTSMLGSEITNITDEHITQARLAGVLDNLIGSNVGGSIGQTLYLLSTELLRFKNEGIAHSQALKAEAARWRRELPEEGRRQRETRRREEHNLMFTQLLEVYQDSINQFLEGLVNQARENEAKLQAYEHAKEVARLAELERLIQVEPEPEEPVSADLLFQLIAPEGLRELTRTCLLILKQKYQETRQCLMELGQAGSLSEENSQIPTEEVEGSQISVSEQRTSFLSREKTFVVNLSEKLSYQSTQLSGSAVTSVESQSRVPTRLLLIDGMDPLEIMGSASTSTTEADPAVVAVEPLKYVGSLPSTTTALHPTVGVSSGHSSSYVYSEVSDMVSSLANPFQTGSALQCPKFGLPGASEPSTAEERLLARVMRDMCYVAGSLLHTAAKILNRALQLAGVPQESFDEALRRTMLVINGALEEVIGLILPKKPAEKQLISEELILEASKIVDEILEKAKLKIAEMKEEDRLKMASSDAESKAKALVEDVIKEAQQQVLRMIVEDFLADLITEATNRVDIISEG